MEKDPKENSKKRLLKGQQDFIRYSGIAFKMLAIIGLGTYGGFFVDQRYPNPWSLGTVIGSLFSVGIAMYAVIKDLNPPHDKD